MDSEKLLQMQESQHPFIRIHELSNLCEEQRAANRLKHSHDFYTIYLISEGQITYRTSYMEQQVNAPALLLVSPNMPHRMELSDKLKGFSIEFNSLFWELTGAKAPFDIADLFNAEQFKTTLPLRVEDKNIYQELSQNLLKESKSEALGGLHMQHSLLNVYLLNIYRAMELVVKQQENDEKLRHAQVLVNFKQLVNKKYKEDKSVQTYADELNLNPNCLNEISKNLSGITASEVIRNKVLQEAQKMLLTGNLSFKEIGFELGFNDPAYFSRYFKKYVGKTLSSYRNSLKELSM